MEMRVSFHYLTSLEEYNEYIQTHGVDENALYFVKAGENGGFIYRGSERIADGYAQDLLNLISSLSTAIENQGKAIETKADKTTVADLNESVQSAVGKVSQFEQDMQDLNTDFSVLSGTVEDNTEKISANSTSITGLVTRVEEAEEALAEKETALDNKITENTKSIQANSTAISGKASQSDLNALSNTVNSKASSQALLELSSLVAQKATQSDLEALSNIVSDNADAIEDNAEEIKTIKGNLTTINEEIDKVDAKFVDYATKTYVDNEIDEIEIAYKAADVGLSNSISDESKARAEAISGLDKKIGTINTTLGEHTEAIGKKASQSALDDLKEMVDTHEESITDSIDPALTNHTERIGVLENDLKELLDTTIPGIVKKEADDHSEQANSINAINTALEGKSDEGHTHKYAGSSSVGGAANSANRLNTDAGSTTQPVYFVNGIPVQTTYALNKTVPSNAKFTDTIYTHPTHTAKDSGLYKVTVDGLGHVTGTAAVVKSDITALGIPAQDTTYEPFVKSGTGASAGLVPAPPTTAGSTKYLREDGTWVKPPNTTYKAGDGLSLSNNTFTNTGVLTVKTGSANGTVAVNGEDVAVKGLGSAAYTDSDAYAPKTHGTHVSYGTSATAVGSTASAGTAATVSRSDHTHSLSKSAVTTALGYTPPTENTTYTVATSSKLGLVKSGTDITVDSSGNVSVNDSSHKHELSNINGVTATVNELNIMDGVTATTAEINHLSGVKSDIQDQLDNKSNEGHHHNGSYYTKTEVDTKLGQKSNEGHHHNGSYYTKTEVNTKLGQKSDEGHNHNTVYYTKTEVNTALKKKSDEGHNHDNDYDAKGAAQTALTTANLYTDTAVANLVDSAPGTLDTLNELATALGQDENLATTLTEMIANKAGLEEMKVHTENTDNPHNVTAAQVGALPLGSVSATANLASGTKVGSVTVNGTTTDFYCEKNTDTKNTAGSTNSSSKLFLIGATSQAANPQTYSHDTVYVGTDGCLYSNSEKVAVKGDIETLNATKAPKTAGVYYIEGSGTTDTTNKKATWTGAHSEITEYYDGLVIAYKIGTAGSTTTTLNINSLGAITVVKNATTGISTAYPVNSIVLLVYTTDGTTNYWKIADQDVNTRNTVGDYRKNATKLYFVGTTTSNNATSSSYATSYTNSNIYVDTSNVLNSTSGFKGALDGNAATATSAASATKATKDGSDNIITTTYETKTDASAKLEEAKAHTNSVAAGKSDVGHRHDNATTDADGFMSSADKTKLNGISDSADSVSFSRKLTSGTEVGTITINGTGTKIYAPTNTDTHYTTGLKVGASATAIANAVATNGNVHLNVLDNETVRDSHKIVGEGATTVTSDANGVITISSTDNNNKVTQTLKADNKDYPLLLAPSGQTSTKTTTSYFDSGVTLNPSTNTIKAHLVGNVTGVASEATNAERADSAAEADKLATAKTISLTGDATGSATFDGSTDIDITVEINGANHTHNASQTITGTLPIDHGGTGLNASPSLIVNLAGTNAVNILDASPQPGVTGTLPIGHGGTGADNAATARDNLGVTNEINTLRGEVNQHVKVLNATDETHAGLISANKGNIETLQAELITETNERSARDEELADNIIDVNDRVDAVIIDIAAVDGRLTTEKESLKTDITTETNARIDADEELQGQIITNADNIGNLTTSLQEEATARANADTGLSARIDTNEDNIAALQQTATQSANGLMSKEDKKSLDYINTVVLPNGSIQIGKAILSYNATLKALEISFIE